MNVKVLMFGALADRATRHASFDLVSPVYARDVVAAVRDRFPAVVGVLERCRIALNETFVDGDHEIFDGDEVALLPPVSGGAVHVLLTDVPSVDRAVAATSSPSAGGTVTFIGTVRDNCEHGRVDALEYTAYDAMATKVMHEIASEAASKWTLHAVAIEHAVGRRAAGEITFVVVCSAAHRGEAFDACSYVVDEVKSRVPVWKKESGPWGSRWVGEP